MKRFKTGSGTRRLLASLGVLVLLASNPARASDAGVPSVGLWSLRYGDRIAAGAGHQVGYVVLQEYMRGLIPTIRAASPGVKILVYKDVAATVSKACHDGVDDVYLPAGVGYCWAEANHPEWFLTDTTGQRIEFDDYPELWYMDVGNPAYQEKWASNVEAVLASADWDGVMMDDVLTWGGHLGSRTIEAYPTWAAIEGAFETFLAAVGPRLMDTGAEVIPNIAFPWATGSYVDVYKRLLTYTSGSVREFSATWSSGSPFGGEWWTFARALHDHTVAVGKTYLAVDYVDVTNPDLLTYARASFLMGMGEPPGALMVVPPSSSTDPWHPAWTIDIGAPVGPRYQLDGVWRRTFTQGLALANPSTATVTVPLGAPYQTYDGTLVTQVTLAPNRGAVLRLVEPAAVIPEPPVLTARGVSSTAIDLGWTAVQGATAYRVERSKDGGTTWSLLATLPSSTLTFRNTSLRSSTTYTYRVAATSAAWNPLLSNVVSATTSADTSRPSRPKLSTATSLASVTDASVTWTRSTDYGGAGLAGYRIYRSRTGTWTSYKLIGRTSVATRRYADRAVARGVRYWYVVVAFDGASNHSLRSNAVSVVAR